MLNFDLMDTVAGQQVHEMGLIEDAREMVLDALDVRFGIYLKITAKPQIPFRKEMVFVKELFFWLKKKVKKKSAKLSQI